MIHRRETFKFHKLAFEEIETDPPWDVERIRVGIDPGTANMGVAILVPERAALLCQVKMERRNTTMMERLARTREALSRIFYYFDTPDFVPLAIIEGASHGDVFGQVELAEQRAGIGLWLNERYHCPVQVIPPTTIYKRVFGSGKIRAWNEWPQYPRDAASALAAALFPVDILEERV